jgi:uncharacterized protein YkwD
MLFQVKRSTKALITITVLFLFTLIITLPVYARNKSGQVKYQVIYDTRTNTSALKPENPNVSFPESQSISKGWLNYLNHIRSIGNLSPVREDPWFSRSIIEHARYMVRNNVILHDQDPSRPYFTRSGQEAARNSNIIASPTPDLNYRKSIDAWITCAFHGLCIIDPSLLVAGYGDYIERGKGFQSGAGLDVLRGRGALPEHVRYPIMWPANGRTTHLTSYAGGEWPDPLYGSGFKSPTGAPVYLQLGNGNVRPNVTAHSFKLEGKNLPHIVLDENTYRNPDRKSQDVARIVMRMRSGIILIPRDPLIPGKKYDVSITSNNQTYSWSFYVDQNAK